MIKKKKYKVLLIILIITLIIGIPIAITYHKYKEIVVTAYKNSRSKINSIDDTTFIKTSATNIYDKNNNKILSLNCNNYKYVKLNDTSKNVSNAFISIEDKNFYKHRGYSIKGMSRALFIILKSKGKPIQGGSTITQQIDNFTTE